MNLKVEYNESIKNKINTRLDNRIALVDLVIEICKFLLIKNNLSGINAGFMYFDSESRRIFVSEKNPKTNETRHFSFQFPFKLEQKDTQMILSTYNQDLVINSSHLQVLRSLLQEDVFTENRYRYGLSINLAELIEEKLFELDLPKFFVDEINDLLLELLLFEPSYMRFDEHLAGERGKIHPLFHFDIFYSQQTTLKVGYDRLLSYEDFQILLNREEKECLYLG